MTLFTRAIPVLTLVVSSHAGTDCDWLVEDSPAPNTRSLFYDVAFVSDSEAWAVGRSDDYFGQFDFDQKTLAARWDGEAWTQTVSPSPGLFENGGITTALYAVEVISSDDVWAGGTWYTQHVDGFVGFQSLALHWDGSSWSQVETPFTPVGGTGASINDFVSFGSDDVWAVGSRVDPETPNIDEVPLTLRWDGSDWSEAPVAPIVNQHQGFRAIDAFDQESIWAVGGHGPSAAKDHSYIAHWNGGEWDLEAGVPDPGLQSHLFDLVVIAPDDIWVVGQENIAAPGTRPLFLHYDGGSWAQVIADSFTHYSGRLEAVSAVSADDIWAVGTYALDGNDPARPLLMHYDGTSWTQVAEDPAGPTFGWFRGVDTAGECDAVAVGQQSPGLLTHVQRTTSTDPTSGDLNADGLVDTTDLLLLLGQWGTCLACDADLDVNRTVDLADLLILLANWS